MNCEDARFRIWALEMLVLRKALGLRALFLCFPLACVVLVV